MAMPVLDGEEGQKLSGGEPNRPVGHFKRLQMLMKGIKLRGCGPIFPKRASVRTLQISGAEKLSEPLG